jgi:hypothetical protein
MSQPNTGLNIGHSGLSIYDEQAYQDYLSESVSPLLYKLNPSQNNNCNACLSVFGPRASSGPRSHGVSSFVGHTTAPAQDLVDLESVLSNRNVLASRRKDGQVNDIDVTKFKLQHARVCNDFLDPVATHLTNPPANYRGMNINRFYNLPKNPQENIYYDWGINTQLEAKDNYRERVPRLIKEDLVLPREFMGDQRPCKYHCDEQTGTCDLRCNY